VCSSDLTAAPSFTPTTVPTLVPTLVPTTIESQSSIRNLALGMTAVQSSDFSGAIAARAVDGNTDGNLANNSVTHTNEDTQAWWQVDLGSPSPIQSINLWARTDCCEWRTNNVYVLVSDNPILSGALDTARNQAGVSNYLISGLVGRPSTVDIYRTGRYIRVQLTGKDFLSLAEVEVMGGPGVVLPAQSLQSPTAVPSATSTLMPTSIPAATELPTLPANTAMPTFTPLPLDPTIIPSFTPTLVQ
jgi:hypothetical protein